jgi:muramoyltetrapeptide carboxypeptidase LdcA involved in peptidoglycan recycling
MIIPKKLREGDEIRVVAPARSLDILSEKNIYLAKERLERMGFVVTFSKHCRERDAFDSSGIQSRVEDLHTAFSDKNVKAIFAVIGGFNSNQLLRYLDYGLIARNPKILCGYSDITALANAVTAKTGMITYSGMNFSNWAMQKVFEYNQEYFEKCLMREGSFLVEPSLEWSDDAWFLDQENRIVEKNHEYAIIHKGTAEGTIAGGNLCTLNLLQGTEYMPDISGAIIFVEDDDLPREYFSANFDRDLQSLIHQSNFSKVRGLMIGRFQKSTDMTLEKLRLIIDSKEELKDLPVVANVDFGHTNPLITFPIGGTCRMSIGEKVEIEILSH